MKINSKNRRKENPSLLNRGVRYFLVFLKNNISIKIKRTGRIDDLDPERPHDSNADKDAIYGITK